MNKAGYTPHELELLHRFKIAAVLDINYITTKQRLRHLFLFNFTLVHIEIEWFLPGYRNCVIDQFRMSSLDCVIYSQLITSNQVHVLENRKMVVENKLEKKQV